MCSRGSLTGFMLGPRSDSLETETETETADHRPHYAIGYLYQKTVSAFPDVGDTWTPALDLAGLRSPERVNP